MQAVFEKIIEKLEEKARFYNSASDVDQNIRSGVIIAKEIVQETAAEYEVCYNDCGDCEAYNKEKHHCPKFCKVIKETVKEIEENHNDWISCSSGVLPKRSNSYCVTKMCENDGNPIYETCHEIFWTNDNKWDCERDEDCKWRVIAWKEKDKPYQPKGD